MSRRFLPLLAALPLLFACSSDGASSDGSAQAQSTSSGTFPAGFQFGAAIAGFQVEMGCPTVPAETCEDRQSDWYQWITTKRITDNPLLFMSGDPPSTGPGFYELYAQDLDRASGELKNSSVRLSIEWSRIFPSPTFGVTGHDALRAIASEDGIAFYHRVFAAMKERHLRPFVTVNHYTLPLWIHDGNQCNQSLSDCIAAGKGGWADPNRERIVSEIAKYAGFVAEEYGGEVDQWATLNEPFSVISIAGYIVSSKSRSNPPGLSGPWMSTSGAKTAATAMIEAHARMYDAIHAADHDDADGDGDPAAVGIVYPFTQIEPLTGNDADAKASDDAKYFFQDMFMDGVVFGRIDENWDQGRDKAPVRSDIAGRVDFVGVNYYFRFLAQSSVIAPGGFISPFLTFNMLKGFDDHKPQDIYPVLRDVAQRYKKPIYVSETGTLQDDPSRGAAWIVRTLSETRRAIHDGIDVRGYFVWTLTDNYEWNNGTKIKMGLYALDPTTKARTPREAARVFGQMSAAHDVPAALEEQYAQYYP